MSDIFISYAREDLDRARRLAGALESRGWSVWWDRRIVAGQTFDQTIERELESARSVVVLWSKDSIESEWTKNEATAAAERNVLVPALLDDVRIPLEFRRKQTANLIDWDGDASHEGFQALCEGIAGRIGAPSATRHDSGSSAAASSSSLADRVRMADLDRRGCRCRRRGDRRCALVDGRRRRPTRSSRATRRDKAAGPRIPLRRRTVDWRSRRRTWAPYRRRMRTASTIRRRSRWAPSTSSRWKRTRTTISGCLQPAGAVKIIQDMRVSGQGNRNLHERIVDPRRARRRPPRPTRCASARSTSLSRKTAVVPLKPPMRAGLRLLNRAWPRTSGLPCLRRRRFVHPAVRQRRAAADVARPGCVWQSRPRARTCITRPASHRASIESPPISRSPRERGQSRGIRRRARRGRRQRARARAGSARPTRPTGRSASSHVKKDEPRILRIHNGSGTVSYALKIAKIE